ncbi:flagellar hook-length control protein FliK [Stutzerimonas azotifigens]|uniref:flagellar hook-length control protein FliK n=1 Tax=Stutzerimonas azotifigens TaxID=291995 RepID=UPI0003FC4CDA|nr:flagellar hook-length control protein FliK [Stutzerimonas azotifigens]
MTQIKIAAPMPVANAQRAGGAAADLALKLLQPMQGLLLAGESAEAEVVSVREQAQSFQVVLRLTLADGRQALLQASASRPVALGTAYGITALSDSRLSGTLAPAGRQPLDSLDLDLFPTGSLLQGKVVAAQQVADARGQQAIYKVIVSLLDGNLAGRKLSIETSTPLAVGSLLTARVRDDRTLTLIPLGGRLDGLALGQQLGAQNARQGSLDALLGALQRLPGNAPEGLRAAASALLQGLPQMAELGEAKALAQALGKSGLLMEARLLAGHTDALQGDVKAGLLRLVAQLLPNLPGSSPLATNQASANLAQALPAFARSALGALGQAGLRQQGTGFPLPARLLESLDQEPDLEMLLKLAAAAIARLQTHQLSSLAQTQPGPDGNPVTTWQFEVPMRDQQQLVPLQVKVQREDEPADPQRQKDQQPVWRIELAFDVAPLGPLQVQAQLAQGMLSSQLWAERAGTARLIDGELDHLRERLVAAGLTVNELACRQGTPPQGRRTTLQQRFVDETA